ncbi:MAG: hypothetical protein LBG10_04435, partial [Treponema sp.]|nr:hypothetical protein [Treponema sp.]
MRRSGIFGIILIAVVLIFFSFGACDLLINKPEIDLEKTMDAEIAWANAPRLTVGLSYPDEWGGSNPPRGTITSLDIRKGFPFDVEFTPSAAYSVLGWRAYRTSALPANWIDNPAAALEGVKQLEEGAVSIAAAGENKSTVTLTISDPVTLIPWCRDQPRIISTDPSLDVPGVYYSPAKTITITFAAPLDGTTVRFGEDYIMIEARNISDGVPTGPAFNVCGAGEGALTWFNAPVYSLRTITIETGSIIPDENVEITVRVGTGITSALSANGMAGAVSFSYRTRSSSAANIDSWTASYDPDANTITVGYTDSQGTADRREAWYSVNGGPVVRTGIEKDEENKRFIIRNVPRLDTEGVRDGMPAGNTAGYRIYLDLYTGGEITGTAGPVNIWNFGTPGISGSGMSVSSYYPAEEISAQEQLAAMELNNADKKYVLANDITLAEGWTPIGTDTEPFQGKFYGNGHRITVTGGTGGIFGKTDGLIRDLTVHYTGAVSGGDNIGGLA